MNTAQKRKMTYLPLSLQAEIEAVRAEYDLRSFSSALRTIVRFAVQCRAELQELGRPDLFQSHIGRERDD